MWSYGIQINPKEENMLEFNFDEMLYQKNMVKIYS
jgi:hypothetical protein